MLYMLECLHNLERTRAVVRNTVSRASTIFGRRTLIDPD